MTRCSHGYGGLETNGSHPGTGWRAERRDIPSYIAERIDSVENLGRRLLADLAICVTAIVMMLVVLHGGERTSAAVQVSRPTDVAATVFVAASRPRR